MKWFSREKTEATIQINWPSVLDIPLLADLTCHELTQIQALAQRFLRQKRFVPLQGLTLDPNQRARIAALFCLPILKLGFDWLSGFHDVLIYPAPYIVEDEWQDAAGLMHADRVIYSGQSWQQGPIIVNWQEIEESFSRSGFNLIIHELAHKIDMRYTDEINGVPALPSGQIAGWEYDLQQAMETIDVQAQTLGDAACPIDTYAATSPEECFAVLSEYFFSNPAPFVAAFPSLYHRFCLFYQQDPFQRSNILTSKA